ncbi:hypothetical protein, partial [Pseudomonas viridiflava]|uniref:hypothetical protein n=1 Tax=Pseudomonas viridiflava TaxID=33069 RepID=UPI0019CFED40
LGSCMHVLPRNGPIRTHKPSLHNASLTDFSSSDSQVGPLQSSLLGIVRAETFIYMFRCIVTFTEKL